MISRQIMRRLLLVEEFPTLSEVMNDILEATDRDDASAEALTSIVERDHAISVRILRMANSAFYGLRHPVDTMRNAIVVLGFNSVRLLALATSVFDALSSHHQFALDPKDFWMHSLGAAKAAQLLAKRSGGADSVDACFTGGLIHDMGKYVMALALTHEYHAVVEASAKLRCPLKEAEFKAFGCTSSEVGGWLAEKWKLPSNIVTVVSYLQKPLTFTGPERREVAIVALADQISCVAGFGLAGEYGAVSTDGALARELGMTEQDVAEVVEEMKSHLESTRQLIGLMDGSAPTERNT